ncbi:MAG: hypothetical protein DHS80DRAFT_31452 [Piptocephalis tieghemiana]|nr:MAG: hypothetical protein DHS80DRAFT_31452 [Piptocephalis tieghemiana]
MTLFSNCLSWEEDTSLQNTSSKRARSPSPPPQPSRRRRICLYSSPSTSLFTNSLTSSGTPPTTADTILSTETTEVTGDVATELMGAWDGRTFDSLNQFFSPIGSPSPLLTSPQLPEPFLDNAHQPNLFLEMVGKDKEVEGADKEDRGQEKKERIGQKDEVQVNEDAQVENDAQQGKGKEEDQEEEREVQEMGREGHEDTNSLLKEITPASATSPFPPCSLTENELFRLFALSKEKIREKVKVAKPLARGLLLSRFHSQLATYIFDEGVAPLFQAGMDEDGAWIPNDTQVNEALHLNQETMSDEEYLTLLDFLSDDSTLPSNTEESLPVEDMHHEEEGSDEDVEGDTDEEEYATEDGDESESFEEDEGSSNDEEDVETNFDDGDDEKEEEEKKKKVVVDEEDGGNGSRMEELDLTQILSDLAGSPLSFPPGQVSFPVGSSQVDFTSLPGLHTMDPETILTPPPILSTTGSSIESSDIGLPSSSSEMTIHHVHRDGSLFVPRPPTPGA